MERRGLTEDGDDLIEFLKLLRKCAQLNAPKRLSILKRFAKRNETPKF